MTIAPFDIERQQGTSSTGVALPRTPTTTMASFTREYGILRDETAVLDADVGSGHRAAQLHTLELRARELAREDVPTLLDRLSRWGIGWSDIAHVVGVSVQAVRKWRNREPATGSNRLAVARLTALIGLLEDVPVHDPAGWLEIHVLEGFGLTHLDLFRLARPDLLFDLANLRIEPEDALRELDPDWRERFRLDHEVYDAEDGERSIRRR